MRPATDRPSPCPTVRRLVVATLASLSAAGCGDGSAGINGDVWLIGDAPPLFDLSLPDTPATPSDLMPSDSGEDGSAPPDDAIPGVDSDGAVSDNGPVEPPLTVGWCRLDTPATATVHTAETLVVKGRLAIPGLTDRTAGHDADGRVLARVVVGVPDTDPGGWEDAWVAAPTPDWMADTTEYGHDAWQAVVGPVASPGVWEFAFAFSGDGGLSWTFCDRDAGPENDGSEDGYASEDAGLLTVVPNPCAAVGVCSDPPDRCNGNQLEIHANPGICTASGAVATCDYGSPTITPCDGDGAYCDSQSLVCRTNPCDPNPCTSRAPLCDGSVRVTFAAPGGCTIVDATSYRCNWNESARVDCAANGQFCVDGGCRPWRRPAPGELVISEVMTRPLAVGAEAGQWFEVRSRADALVNLAGVGITTSQHGMTVAAETLVPQGGRVVFARNTTALLNGGIVGAQPLASNFALGATADVLTLSLGPMVLARVNYGADGEGALNLAPPAGAALQLDGTLDASVDPRDWCPATTPYGAGDRGTPGQPNGRCRVAITACRLHAPEDIRLPPNTAFSAMGRFEAPGVTDIDRTGNDTSHLIRAEFALAGTDAPADPTGWTWLGAAPYHLYTPQLPDFEPTRDAWTRQLTTPGTPGSFWLAFRVSGDQGATWTYCDRNRGPGADGSENGFALNDRALIDVSNPCLPNPCTNPPPTSCVGDAVLTPAAVGICTINGPAFACDHATNGAVVACPDYCADGACEAWRYPTAPGDLVVTELFAQGSRGPDGTWFEVLNPTDAPLNLAGVAWTLDGVSHAIDATWILEAGAYLVIGRNADLEQNGGVPVDLAFAGFDPDPESGTLSLERGGVTLDSVNWTASWPRGADVSTSLSPTTVAGASAHLQNDNAANWCLATTAFGDGAFGTPGALNSNCAAGVAIIRTVPATGAETAPVDAPVVINFSVPMDAATLTTQTAFGTCSGNIQLSSNDFASCVPFAAPRATLGAGGSTATVTPAPHLTHGLSWKLRVLGAVASSNGVQMGEDAVIAFATARPFACGGAAMVVISQVYGAGGNSGAAWTHDYVELHNRGRKPVTLNGWSLRYASATGTNWSGVTNLEGVIPPGGYFLVRQSGGTSGVALPSPDQESAIAMGASSGKLALLLGQQTNHPTQACPEAARVIDFVAWGTSVSCAEGSDTTGAPAPSTSLAVYRDVAGCVDRNQNPTDFYTAPPVPRNRASRAVLCACPDEVAANDRNPAVQTEADACTLVGPLTVSAVRNTESGPIEGRVFVAGRTDATSGQAAGIAAEIAFGRTGTSPLTHVDWAVVPATFVGKDSGGAEDRYAATLLAPMVTTTRSWAHAFRVSLDGGASWTWCDSDGAGALPGRDFNPDALGAFSSAPP